MGRFKWVYLAIDVPKENLQSPRAVENIFAHLAGGHGTMDLAEKYWEGEYQRWFSFEIVSIEGYIQFIIRTEAKLRDLVESAIYAQYPEAMITEVDDYVSGIPDDYPNETHDVWGTEWTLVTNQYYPIRTYKDFEDSSAEDIFKDPMAALLESFSRIGRGEQIWFQILVKPMGQSWKKGGFELAKQLLGKEVKKPQTWLHKLSDIPISILKVVAEAFGTEFTMDGNGKDDGVNFGMFALTPGERTTIEGIERKVSKVGFRCKIRAVYVAEKQYFNKAHVMYGLVGAIKQFADEGSNALKPDYAKTGTSAHYIFKEARLNTRKTNIMSGYKSRSTWLGGSEFILNTEELATLWHFPLSTVKTPQVSATEAKVGQPPAYLPTGGAPSVDGKPAALAPKKQESIPTDVGPAASVDFASIPGQRLMADESSEMVEEKPEVVSSDGASAGGPPDNLPFV